MKTWLTPVNYSLIFLTWRKFKFILRKFFILSQSLLMVIGRPNLDSKHNKMKYQNSVWMNFYFSLQPPTHKVVGKCLKYLLPWLQPDSCNHMIKMKMIDKNKIFLKCIMQNSWFLCVCKCTYISTCVCKFTYIPTCIIHGCDAQSRSQSVGDKHISIQKLFIDLE